jgi:hypothetical protein
MRLTDQDIADFIGWVIPPGETYKGYDDRIPFSDAVEFARAVPDDIGGRILDALQKLYGPDVVGSNDFETDLRRQANEDAATSESRAMVIATFAEMKRNRQKSSRRGQKRVAV